MSRTASQKDDHPRALPKPSIKKRRWPFPLIWLVPVLAALLAGYYAYAHFANRGPLITISFPDATGLKTGQSQMMHLGVQIGQVEDVQLSPDQKSTLIQIRLNRADASFAKTGSLFWVVRPQISATEISGLATVLSGPYIEAIPGDGETENQFTGLPNPPVTLDPGLRLVLDTSRMGSIQSNSPVYYRGVQVGVVENTALSPNATEIDINVFIQQRFSPLVRSNSQFWAVSGVDVSGGLLGGVQMKVESLRSLIAGGIEFATPDKGIGEQAQNGARFVLHDDAGKDWLTWQPRIPIGSDQPQSPQSGANPARQAIKDLTGGQ